MSDSNPRREFQRKQQQFLQSQRKDGAAKDIGKKRRDLPRKAAKDALLQKALVSDNIGFFNRILDDDTEHRLWLKFLEGRVMMRDDKGEPIRDRNGIPQFHEITGVSWNAFRRMVEYKRGMPVIKVNDDQGKPITVNFNIMGASTKQMEERAKDMGLLPESSIEKV